MIAISAGLSLWNMQSQEVVALAPVSEQSVLPSRVQRWQDSLPVADTATMTCKIKKLDQVRSVRVKEHQLEVKRMREERARKQRMLEIQKCCGVRISESDRTVLEKIVQAEAGNQDHQGNFRPLYGKWYLLQDSFRRFRMEVIPERKHPRIPGRRWMRHCMEWMVPGEPCILWIGAMPMAAM